MSAEDAVVRGTVVAKIHRMLDTIEARDAEIVRLRAEREAIEALHQPQEGLDEYMRPEQWCPACANYWPCPTYLLLHPEEERRER